MVPHWLHLSLEVLGLAVVVVLFIHFLGWCMERVCENVLSQSRYFSKVNILELENKKLQGRINTLEQRLNDWEKK